MRVRRRVLLTGGAIGIALLAWAVIAGPRVLAAVVARVAAPAIAQVATPAGPWDARPRGESLPIKRGDTFDELLSRAGIDTPVRFRMASALGGTFDVRHFRAGTELMLYRWSDGSIGSLEYQMDADRKLRLAPVGDGFEASVVEIPGVVSEVNVCGVLDGSLFESIQRIGEQPELAIRMAEIFAWDLDFNTDPQPGDEFCLVVEKKEYLNGQPPTYQRILAAKYVNQGALYDGYLFADSNGENQYYSRDGKSLRSAFLRSPLPFNARISSRFSNNRFHPVLKRYRPHLGIDYAAPTGSPVQSIASGRVTFSGRSGQSGNLIKIQHANGFETMYMHLSRRLVKKGQRVQQGQRIGLVGATGLATGPHLDFRIRKNGKYLNFAAMKPPRRSQLTATEMPAFSEIRNRYAATMHASEELPMLASTPLADGAAADD